jgi:gliding motility-associated-like protein
MSSNAGDNGRILIANTYENIGDLQLGPNGKIYVASTETRTFTSKISVINAPSVAGTNCNFLVNAIELSRKPILGSIGIERFPTFIADISETTPNSKNPELKLTANCAQSESSFEIKNPSDLIYDSLEWDFGDGSAANTITTKHTYNAAGAYLIRFSWFVCNNKFQITDTIKIIEKLNLNLGNDTTLCTGDTFTLKGPHAAEQYLWNTGDSTYIIWVNKPGKYRLKIQSGVCSAQDEIEINYHPPLFTALGDEYFICDKEKELVKLDAGKNLSSYKWTPTGDTTQWIIVGEIGDYFVVVKDFRGCGAKDNTKVKRICNVSVYFPTAFTPNNDGLNDYFSPIGNDIVGFNMRIYNRWGHEVFISNNLNQTWDGNYNNIPCPTDTYYYTTKYQGYKKKKLLEFEAKGTFTLLR